ncbi:MAG: hypothetical protein IT233_08855 [Bacteroidia bacterium]|nr:hypothetical protein [Bacteroidia bacterium]
MGYNFLLAVLILACGSTTAQLTEVWRRIELQHLVPLNNYYTEPWRGTISTEQKGGFIGELLALADSGAIQIYRPESPFNLPFSKKEVSGILHRYDSIYVFDPITSEPLTQVIKFGVSWEDIPSVILREKWVLDPATGTFSKTIAGMILEKKIISNDGEYVGKKPLCYIAFQMSSVKSIEQVKDSEIRLHYDTEQLLDIDPAYNNGFSYEKAFSLLDPFLKNAGVLYDTLYPYHHPLKGSARKNVLANRSMVYSYYFNEVIHFDPLTFTLTSTLKGILFSSKKQNRGADLAYVALNNLKPQPLWNTNQVLPIMQYQQQLTFPKLPPEESSPYQSHLENEDSVKMDTYTKTISEKSLKMDLPSYKLFGKNYVYFDPLNHKMKALEKAELDSLYIYRDILLVESVEINQLDTVIREHSLLNRPAEGLSFFESWSIDPLTGKFNKLVNGIGVMYGNGEFGFGTSMRLVIPSYLVTTGTTGDLIELSKNVVYFASLNMNGERPNEDTVMLAYVDDAGINSLHTLNRCKLIQALLEICINGKGKAIDPLLNAPISKPKLIPYLNTFMDSTIRKGDLPPYFQLANVLKFVEDWSYDPVSCRLVKKVRAVTLIRRTETYDNNISRIKDQELLTIQLNEK